MGNSTVTATDPRIAKTYKFITLKDLKEQYAKLNEDKKKNYRIMSEMSTICNNFEFSRFVDSDRFLISEILPDNRYNLAGRYDYIELYGYYEFIPTLLYNKCKIGLTKEQYDFLYN